MDSSGDEAMKKDKKKRSKKLGPALALAVEVRRNKMQKEEDKKTREKSSERQKKKKKKSKKDSSSDGKGDQEEESSSSDSMMPPLKKKAKKNPGSVFRLLENEAVEALAQDGVLEESYDPTNLGQRPKLHTYFQLALRPNLDPKTRDCKELGLLARALDLLREGRLEELADLLAARMIAVDTATRQGWSTARHLEVFGGEDVGTVPTHVLLSAQRYNRQVEKAGGKGSWTASQTWGNDWNTPNKGKGKTSDKGKGKKPKGKGKGPWKGAAPKEDEAKTKPDA